MNIFFDCRYVRIGRHDGISRYTASLVTELAELHPVIMLISDERQLEMLPPLPWRRFADQTSLLEPLAALRMNRLVSSPDDVVFSPLQTMGSLGRRYRLVLTVHDLIYYRHRRPPRDMPGIVRLVWRLYHLSFWPQRMLLNGADAIVAVSETTRGLIGRYGLTKRPVHVVANAAGEPSAAAAQGAGSRLAPMPAAGEKRLIVHMGQFTPYKNVDALVQAMEFLPGYELRLMSRVTDAERERLLALVPATVRSAIVFVGGASDEEYEAALLRAQALVTTSLDEGFGIPVVEAMRVGTPVVASDIPIFREVGGEASVFVDPRRPQDVARGIRMLEDDEEWTRRSRASVAQAARFDWAASARALYEVLLATRPSHDLGGGRARPASTGGSGTLG